MRKTPYHILLVLIGLLFSSCFGTYEDRIRIDGSSSLFPLTEAVSEDFRSVYPEIKITVGVSGTGGGIMKFGRGEIDIVNASRPLTEKEINFCTTNNVSFIEVPVTNDGLVIAVNKSNSFINYLTVNELKKLWEPSASGKILYWDQIRSEWPHLRIQLFGAGTSSGSFDFFTKNIVGTAKASRGDYTASEDDNFLVQGLSGAKGGLGFFGRSYFIENEDKLKAIPIDDEDASNGKGAYFATEESINYGHYQPLSRIEFLYINTNAATKNTVKTFVDYYLSSANKLAKEIGGIPLRKEIYVEGMKRFDDGIVGSIIQDGENINSTEILNRLKKGNEKSL